MADRQQIVRVRRQYNQWVADQTLEDYALRFTADKARRWSSFRVGNTALGAISFLACEAIGGTITLAFGFDNAMAAILAVGLLIFVTSLPIGYYAAKFGVDMDLLTRGAGFGYIGSTITSLIYACFTFILFSVEATIMSQALEMVLRIPIWIAHIISALMVLPIAALGIRGISRMQLWTQPIWLILQLAPLAYIFIAAPHTFDAWSSFPGLDFSNGSFNLLSFGMASTILLSLIPQIGEQVDYLRFLPDSRRAKPFGWWWSMLSAGPGWIFIGAAKLVAGSLLTYIALQHSVSPDRASQPPELYRLVFTDLFHSRGAALALTGIFVVVCQTKINVTNAYAGSIAWSNFFARLTHSHPGRVVWLTFNVMLALVLMEMDIFKVIDSILGVYSNLAVAWIGAVAADLVINKPLGLSPPGIEFRRAHLYDINPVGVGAMALSLIVSGAAHFGLFGAEVRALAPLFGFLIAFVAAPSIAWATKGKYYIARPADVLTVVDNVVRCSICENSFEPSDMSHCPAYGGAICSLCCSLEMRCHDRCKEKSRLGEQIGAVLGTVFSTESLRRLDTRINRFLAIFVLLVAVTGAFLGMIDFEYGALPGVDLVTLHFTLEVVFTGLFVIMGLSAWALVLAHESRHLAERESDRQTAMLVDEIEAHKRTDAALQKAKEVAEAANVAKTRFIAGLSHEIRTPLNSISGYAQLLARNSVRQPEEAIRVIRRSSEHIANLVDGLLDISKIEAGSLQLSREIIRFGDFLDQLVDMFRLQAAAKGIEVHCRRGANLPAYVYADAKRLRQILLNLLSNAINYTEEGHVLIDVKYRNGIAEFEIIDTGIGISAEDLQRVFEPFERGSSAGNIPGTGLGLTISKLFTQIFGGDLSVVSEPGRGSAFKVRLMLSEATPTGLDVIEHEIRGYRGDRRTVLVVDDNPSHAAFVEEFLAPLGFAVLIATDGQSALDLAVTSGPDLVILDIAMPGMTGWEVATALRERGMDDLSILMVSANAHELTVPHNSSRPHDDYLVKPFELSQLGDRIQTLLGLDWIHEVPRAAKLPQTESLASVALPEEHVMVLRQLGEIGHVRGIQIKLDELEHEFPESTAFLNRLRELARDFEFESYRTALATVREHVG